MWLKIFLVSFFWTNILSTSFDLSGVVSGNRMAAVPLGRSLGEGELDIEGVCAEAGMACQNCTHAVTCIPLPGGWLKVPLQQCPDGQTCNAHQRQCSNDPVPECNMASQGYRHTCEQVGIFPDAYDCRKFHLCSPPEGFPDGRPADHREGLCPRHYAYNPRTAQCSIQLQRGQCSQRPVPNCTKVGQAGALESSPNHYYVCLSRQGYLYPQIFLCPHGWYFWDNFCRPEPAPPKVLQSSTAKPSTYESKVMPSNIDAFFSTEKATTYAADTFLADKFDLTNYESTDDSQSNPNSNDEFANSFESGDNFW